MINTIAKTTLCLATVAPLSFSACSKKQEKATEETPVAQPTAVEDPAPVPEPVPEKAPEVATAGSLVVKISHAEPKPTDPVTVTFPTMTVVSAKFDKENLEGATATVEFDIAAMASGIAKRDGHLASEDYLNVAGFPKGTIIVKDVKKKEGQTYSATAEVNVHGVGVTWPVEFSHVSTDASGAVTIEATHSFKRSEFGIGKSDGDTAADQLDATLKLTLTNS